ncbi:ABC-type Zn2+ transport system, periplasmic component/surface adhesin [Spongiibacter sp. IMCC21906]|uniref:metal ABC transporter solute-binding protein, Zn/Mn family n=1 Tax=Spongiibacter sp. IMCC21906 TaxID=1620392 RepID=UPI00062E0C3D|nr:zinc ABC transporter substrate-binding protein [Spongiibacter sp. IMCC21906]AKH68183.1 ABC-type Zn2+ transport system, periplasmic component/surface adhesin [Spongiibacter sp. IMCC21906]
MKQVCVLMMLLIWMVAPVSAQDRPIVLSSVMPLHLLVAEIGGDAIDSQLLIPATLSPHDFQLKPSDAQRMHDATAVIWVGPGLEPGLRKLLKKLDQAQALYPVMEVGEDPHVWLDGALVQQIAHKIARVLSSNMPARSAFFHANAARFGAEFRAFDKQLAQRFKQSTALPYLLLHDGFSRFESHYQLPKGEVVMSSDEQMPGARHIVELRKRLQAGEFACVFREPQYSESLLEALTAGLEVPVIEVDPLGYDLNTADGFLSLYRQLGEAFLSCFKS